MSMHLNIQHVWPTAWHSDRQEVFDQPKVIPAAAVRNGTALHTQTVWHTE